MPMILTTTAIYPLSNSWTRAPSSSSSSSSSTRDTIRTTSFIRRPPSLLSLAFLSIVDATTRLARKRKSGKSLRKRALSFVESATLQRRFLALKKRGINPTPSSRRRRRARDRDPTKPTPFVRDDSFPFREFFEKANVSFLSSSSSRHLPLVGRRFFFPLSGKNSLLEHTPPPQKSKEKGKHPTKKKQTNNRRLNRRKPTRHALARPTMNEIGSGAFAFTAALMVSSTRLERLCVSMYSWIDIYLLTLR